MVGLILTFTWRWHDLSPVLVVFRLLAIFTVLSYAFLLFKPRLGVLRAAFKRPYVVCLCLWTLWMLAGVPTALDSTVAWDFWRGFQLKNLLLFVFVASTLASLRDLHLAVLANIAGMSAAVFFYIKMGMPQGWTPFSMYDRNDLALLFNMTIPMVAWAGVSLREGWARTTAWIILVAAVVCVIGTQSRGGLLALAVSSVFFLIRFKGVGAKAKTGFVVSIAVVLLMAPDAYWERMSTILNPQDDYNITSETGRIEIWKRGLNYTRDNWVFGVGAENFPIAEVVLGDVRDYRPGTLQGHVTHNSFLQIASENGVPGLLLFLAAFGWAFHGLSRTARRLRKTRDPTHASMAQLCDLMALSLVTYMVGGFFLSQGYFSYVMVLMGLVAGTEYVAEKHLSSWRHRRRGQARARARQVPSASRSQWPVPA